MKQKMLMTKITKKIGKTVTLFMTAVLVLTGCATAPEAYKDIDIAMQSNDFEAGIAAIKKGQEGKKPLYDEKNAVSLYLDKGLLEHYAGNYASSSADLQQAERLIEEAFTKSVTQEVASYIANDNAKEYPGEDFEDIYINVFNALNYYNKGDLEGALVEIRKLTWTNGKLDMLGRKYEGAKAGAGEYVLNELGKLGLKINPELPQGDSVNFSDSALARYLGALFYLGNGNADSARIEFERLRAAYAANPNVYYHPFPESAMAARNVPQGKARLNVIGFAGLSPVKEEGVFVSAFPFFQNQLLWVPEFKLPKFVMRPNRIDRIEIVVEGADAFNLELIEDMGAVAEETYNARFGSLFFKTYIRTLLKYAAVDVAAVAAGQTKGGDLAQTAAAVAGKKAADASESADIRMSRYFPGRAYIGGVNLDPGSYTVAVRYYQANNVVATEERRVDVNAGALNLLEVINLGGGGSSRSSGGGIAAGDGSSDRSSNSSWNEPAVENSPHLRTIGLSLGTAFADPWMIATIHGTFSPARHLFLELGLDAGFMSTYDSTFGTGDYHYGEYDDEDRNDYIGFNYDDYSDPDDLRGYFSFYPFVHIGGFIPFREKGGWYIGGGGGWMGGRYIWGYDRYASISVFAADFITGFNIGNVFDISYTMRTNFKSASNKLSLGYVHRFK